MYTEDGLRSLSETETEAEYTEQKMREYLAMREKNIRKLHFNYSRRR
jgi:hypothetical protein